VHDKFFLAIVIVFSAAVAAFSGSALAQNQTSSLSANTANMTLDAVKDTYLSVWNQTEFNATFSTFVQPFSAAGYGVYEERGSVFEPGETMVLYVEPIGYDFMQILDDRGNTLYMMNMTADYTIADAAGTELAMIKDVPVGSIVSHRPNTELFLELSLTQASPFPEGDYLITYVVTDEVSGESFTLEKQVTIAKTSTPTVA
jgi:hypothetical protein